MTNLRAIYFVLAVCAAFMVGILSATPAHANFEDGVRAYLAQDYAAALDVWRPLAEEGHAPAQFGMGLSYENGRGVEHDPTQAAVWYHKAAEQGLADAQFNLGNLYLNASGVPKDSVEAVRWFRRAAEQGMPHAQVNLGYSYETGSGVAKDPAKAVSWYRRAAEQSFPQAQYYLGAAYERGSGVETDPPLAAAWYKSASDQGVVLASKRLDALKEKGVEPDLSILTDATPVEEPVEPEPSAQPASEPSAEAEPESSAMPEPEPESKVSATKPEAPAAALEVKNVEKAVPQAETIGSEAATMTAPAGEQVASLTGSFRVRLASYRKPPNAHKGWKILANKYVDLLGNLNYALAEVDLGAEKGIYHRLEAGPFGSLAEAQVICAEIKSRKDGCVTVKP